jgi:hypothetical protein
MLGLQTNDAQASTKAQMQSYASVSWLSAARALLDWTIWHRRRPCTIEEPAAQLQALQQVHSTMLRRAKHRSQLHGYHVICDCMRNLFSCRAYLLERAMMYVLASWACPMLFHVSLDPNPADCDYSIASTRGRVRGGCLQGGLSRGAATLSGERTLPN